MEQKIDLHRLQQFVDVVETGSLTDAAARQGVTQQALSAAMRALEAQVGVQLFTRVRGMHPSAAGSRLYESAQLLLAGADRAMADARATGAGKPAVLRVGHTPAISSVDVFDAVGGLLPHDAGLHSLQMFPRRMPAALLSGEIDLVLRRGVQTPRGITGVVMGFHRLNVAFREDEAPEAQEVELRELTGRRLILWSPESQSRYSAFLVAQCRRSGFDPLVEVSRFQGLDPVAAPLITTGAFALVAQSPGRYLDGRIRVLALRDAVTAPFQALWLPTAQTGLIGEVVRAIQARQRPPGDVDDGCQSSPPTGDRYQDGRPSRSRRPGRPAGGRGGL